MSEPYPTFPVGSVGYNLALLHGTWRDRVEVFELDGRPLADDSAAGSPGPSPYDNLVYIEFDGARLMLTNVHIRGRDPVAKTFGGELRDDLLYFDSLGPGAYQNIGMSGGPGIMTFAADALSRSTDVYMEPDFIVLTAPDERIRHTVLYRDGKAVRTLTANGTRLSPSCHQRHSEDPRGPDGPVHGDIVQATIWEHLLDE